MNRCQVGQQSPIALVRPTQPTERYPHRDLATSSLLRIEDPCLLCKLHRLKVAATIVSLQISSPLFPHELSQAKLIEWHDTTNSHCYRSHLEQGDIHQLYKTVEVRALLHKENGQYQHVDSIIYKTLLLARNVLDPVFLCRPN